MAGFGASKEKELAEEAAAEKKATPAHKRSDNDPFSDLREEYQQLHKQGPKTHIFMAIIGKENTGKSAIVFDFFQKYCDRHGGRQTTLEEFDEEASE